MLKLVKKLIITSQGKEFQCGMTPVWDDRKTVFYFFLRYFKKSLGEEVGEKREWEGGRGEAL